MVKLQLWIYLLMLGPYAHCFIWVEHFLQSPADPNQTYLLIFTSLKLEREHGIVMNRWLF